MNWKTLLCSVLLLCDHNLPLLPSTLSNRMSQNCLDLWIRRQNFPWHYCRHPDCGSRRATGVEDLTWEQVDVSWRNHSLWRTHTGAGEKCEEEGMAERSCCRLTTTHHSPSPLRCSGQRVGRGSGDEEVKLSLGKKGGWREDGGLILVFVSQHPNLF